MGDEEFDSALDPPVRIFERLSQIAGYTWDESRPPAHSSYDNWYAFPKSGLRTVVSAVRGDGSCVIYSDSIMLRTGTSGARVSYLGTPASTQAAPPKAFRARQESPRPNQPLRSHPRALTARPPSTMGPLRARWWRSRSLQRSRTMYCAKNGCSI